MMELSYDSRMDLLLSLISSLSPNEACSNRLKIKGNRAVLPSDAENSRLRGVAYSDVQILLKNVLLCCVPLQFPYVIEFWDKPILKNALRFQ